MPSLIGRAESYFDFASLNTNWRTEILAGFTTFMTMAYIVFVNPSILHETGMPLAAVTAATCLSANVNRRATVGGIGALPALQSANWPAFRNRK